MLGFRCRRQYNYYCGTYDTANYFVVANSSFEALGLCLDAEPGSTAQEWELQEISLTESCAHHIYSYGR